MALDSIKHVHRYKVCYKRFVCYSTFERACVIVYCGAQSNEHCCFFSINSRKTRFSLLSSRLAVLKIKTLTQKRMLGNLN